MGELEARIIASTSVEAAAAAADGWPAELDAPPE
jgi:hypothetical protein